MLPLLIGNPGKTVAGQIDQTTVFPEREKVNELRSARGLAGACELASVDYDVDGAGFAGIRAPGHSDLPAVIGQELLRRVGAQNEFGIWVLGHGIWPRPIVYNQGPA